MYEKEKVYAGALRLGRSAFYGSSLCNPFGRCGAMNLAATDQVHELFCCAVLGEPDHNLHHIQNIL
jgi:hypothetical protein